MKIYVSSKEALMLMQAIDALETNMSDVDYGNGEHAYSLSEVKALENFKQKLLRAFG